MVSYVDLHDFGGCWKVFSPSYNSEIGSFDAAHSVIIQFTVPRATTPNTVHIGNNCCQQHTV